MIDENTIPEDIETLFLMQGPKISFQTQSHHLLLRQPHIQLANRLLRNYLDHDTSNQDLKRHVTMPRRQ